MKESRGRTGVREMRRERAARHTSWFEAQSKFLKNTVTAAA